MVYCNDLRARWCLYLYHLQINNGLDFIYNTLNNSLIPGATQSGKGYQLWSNCCGVVAVAIRDG